jgi:hypothetical protein
MRIAVVYDFPPFDAGLFDAAEFLISGGNARLLIKVAEHSDIILRFKKLRGISSPRCTTARRSRLRAHTSNL